MKKIPTVFVRDFDNDPRYVTREVTPGCEWVLAGEGAATRKWDGTCVRLDEHGQWWARREVKKGRNPPPGFVAEEHDDTTGKTVGWESVEQSAFVKHFRQALERVRDDATPLAPGTYELCGPKINGNPDRFEHHVLVPHGAEVLDGESAPVPRDFDGLHGFLADRVDEGIVWHHPDGRMAKLKRKDFPADGS